MASGEKIQVTLRSLIQRTNRKLVFSGRVLKKTREGRNREQLGLYYLIDLTNASVYETHVDPVELAQELGVLAPWEVPEEVG